MDSQRKRSTVNTHRHLHSQVRSPQSVTAHCPICGLVTTSVPKKHFISIKAGPTLAPANSAYLYHINPKTGSYCLSNAVWSGIGVGR